MIYKIVDQEGNVYKGEVLRGKRHGRGTIVYAETRDVYQGDFENDVPHGAGRYFRAGAANGLFEGLWKDGELYQVKKGRACIEDSNGDHYDGGFDHWKRHGRGTLTSANGDIYEGYWKYGLQHGHGVLRYNDGTVFEGQFIEGTPMNEGEFEDFDEKTIGTLASDFDNMGLNPYQTNGGTQAEEREGTGSFSFRGGIGSDTKRMISEERRPKAKTRTEEKEQREKEQPKKNKKDLRRKLDRLEKAKAGKGQFQVDRRKYLIDAKRDLEKKRLKESGETGPGKKIGQSEKIVRKRSDVSEKGKNKNGFFKLFQRERSRSRGRSVDEMFDCENKNDETRLDDGHGQSSSADVKIEGKGNHQAYSSRPPALPPAHPRSDSQSPLRSRPNSRTTPLDSRKRAASAKETRNRSNKSKKGKDKSRAPTEESLRSLSSGRSRSSPRERGGEGSGNPFPLFKSRSKSWSKANNAKKATSRAQTSSNASKSGSRASKSSRFSRSSKMSNHSTNTSQSHQRHTLDMLGGSSDSDDGNFFLGNR